MSASKKIIALLAVVYVMTVIQVFARREMSDQGDAQPVLNNMKILLREMLAAPVPGAWAAKAITVAQE